MYTTRANAFYFGDYKPNMRDPKQSYFLDYRVATLSGDFDFL